MKLKKILKSNGFNIVDFDKKNFLEQLKIITNADILGGLHRWWFS